MSDSDLKSLESTLNTELGNVTNWLKANKLSLNIDKTKIMVFRHCNQSSNYLLPPIHLDNELLEEVDVVKYLGVKIDHKLTYRHHISLIIEKLTKGNTLLAKLRHFLPKNDLKNFYHAQLQSHLNYCSLNWASGSTTEIRKLKRLQDKAIKLLCFVKNNNDLPELYKQNNIMPIGSTIAYKDSLFIWNVVNKNISDNICNIFEEHSVHFRNLQENNKFIQPFRRTTVGKTFTTCRGIKTWNSLDDELRKSTSLAAFKRKLKIAVQSSLV